MKRKNKHQESLSDYDNEMKRLFKELAKAFKIFENKLNGIEAFVLLHLADLGLKMPRTKTINRPITDFQHKGSAPKKYRLLSTLLANTLEKAEIYTPWELFENHTQKTLLGKKLIGPGRLKEILIFANAFGVKIPKR